MSNIAKFEEHFNTTIDRIQYDGHIVDELKENIESLKRTLVRIYAVAPLYSFNNQEYNGLYSFIKICVAFQNIITSNISHNNYDKLNGDLLIISRLFCVMSSMLQMLVKTHLKDLEPKVSIFTESTDQLFDILDLCSTKFKPALSYIYGNYCAFWLCPSMKRSMGAFTTIMAAHASSSAKSSLKCIWKSNYRGTIISNLAHSANIYFIKSFWSLTEYSFINEAVPSLFTRSFLPKIVKDFSIHNPQNIFTILENDNFISKTTDTSVNTKKEIKCRLLFEKDDNLKTTDTIIIHCHGGGFVSQSPRSHEIYLRDWSKKLVNVPIISIDYILSPEGRYPQALQQILDVYLWFIEASNEQEIIELIGFNPKQIILCGDSAGGNLVAATCLALNDIRTLFSENIRMPKSVMLIYTPLMLKLFSSPSRMLTTFDCLLPLGILLSCLEAYLNLGEVDETLNEVLEVSDNLNDTNNLKDLAEKSDDDIDHDGLFKCAQLNFLVEKEKSLEKQPLNDEEFVFVNKDEVEATGEDTAFKFPNDFTFKFQRGYFNAIDRIKKSFYGSISPKHLLPSNLFSFNASKKPWYIDQEENLRRKIEILDSKCSRPYVSPLLYSKFTTLSDVSLFLVTSEFDVCLDDSVMMAKKWTGPVCLDVCENLPHGFLNFLMFSEEAKQASNLCITRLKQALFQR